MVCTHMCWFVYEPITPHYLLLPDTSVYLGLEWYDCVAASFVYGVYEPMQYISIFFYIEINGYNLIT